MRILRSSGFLTRILKTDIEIIVHVRAFDEVFSNTVVQRTSYVSEEIVYGAKFVPMYYPIRKISQRYWIWIKSAIINKRIFRNLRKKRINEFRLIQKAGFTKAKSIKVSTESKETAKNLDYVVQETHDEVFENIDCLQCANCCKTTGPLYTEKDIERIAKHLRMKPADFEAKYLRIDEDNDKVLQHLPASFKQ